MKKLLFSLSALAVAIPMACSAAWAPDGDINVIVSYKAGSGTDTGARLLTIQAEKVIGKTLIINNIPGGGGKIGWTKLANAKPDGRTIGFLNLPNFFAVSLKEGSTLSLDSFVPIANHLTETGVVVVKADSPYKTLKDLVNAAKKNPNLKASTNGKKASNHIGAQLLAKSAGFMYKDVPYGGTADQLLALRQGEVDFACVKVADIAKLAKGDNPVVRVLGVFSEKRVAEFKDVPTLGELGYYNKWFGSMRCLVAPKGTPKEIIDYYTKAFKKTMDSAACMEAHQKAGMAADFIAGKALADKMKAQENFAKTEQPKLFDK